MRAKLTVAQYNVLKAYRDHTTHNQANGVTDKVLKAGYLAPVFDANAKRWGLELSRDGLLVLEAYERREGSQR